MTQISIEETSSVTRESANAPGSMTKAQAPTAATTEATFRALQATFTAAPVLAGLDKFTNLMTDWEKYLDPRVPRILGIRASTFMRLVGTIEVAAGIGVAINPKIFGRVVSGWLFGIIGNLLMKKDYYDIALRDLGLAAGAFTLSELAANKRMERDRRTGQSKTELAA